MDRANKVADWLLWAAFSLCFVVALAAVKCFDLYVYIQQQKFNKHVNRHRL